MKTLILLLLTATSALALTSNEQAQLCVAVGGLTNNPAIGLDSVKIRKALLAVTVASSSNRLVITTRDANLVFQEKSLNLFGAARGFNPTNSAVSIYGVYSNLIANASTPDAATDLQNEWLTVKNSKQVIQLSGGDYSGTSLRSNIVVDVTYTQPLWTLGVPDTASIEACFPKIPEPVEE